MHGPTGRGWKRNLGHRASPSPYLIATKLLCAIVLLTQLAYMA